MLKIACQAASLFAHPAVIAGVPLFCLAWWLVGLTMEPLLVVLSVLAITMSQLILLSSDNDTAAMQRKMDELIRVEDKADDSLVGLEKRTKE